MNLSWSWPRKQIKQNYCIPYLLLSSVLVISPRNTDKQKQRNRSTMRTSRENLFGRMTHAT